MLRSTDDGATWTDENEGLGSLSAVYGIAEVPGFAAQLVLSSDDLLVRSADGGQTYTTLWSPGAMNNYHVSHVRVLPSGAILAATWTGIAIAADGMNFTTNSYLAGSPQYVTDLEALDTTGTNLIATTEQVGVYVSQDGGTSWTPANEGLANSNINCFAQLPDGTLLVGSEGGVFRASSALGTWSASGLPDLEIDSLLAANNEVVAGTATGVYVSHDDGMTWTAVPGLAGWYVISLAVDSNGTLLAGTAGNGLFRAPFP